MLITFSSDYLYLQAMLKTTPLVATIGISLCLPISIVADWWIGQLHLTLYGFLGSILVLASFIVLGYEEDDDVDGESQSLLDSVNGVNSNTYNSTT